MYVILDIALFSDEMQENHFGTVAWNEELEALPPNKKVIEISVVHRVVLLTKKWSK